MTATATSPAVQAFATAWPAHRRRQRMTFWVVTGLLLIAIWLSAEFSGFFRVTQITLADGSRAERWVLGAGLPRLGEFAAKMIPDLGWDTLWADLADWFWRWRIWLRLLVETMLIAFMATAIGVSLAFALSFQAARNLAPSRWVLWVTRRYFELARTVPELVFALIFVFCFGAGPMAGVLAIALHTTGALGKLYSEVNENIDMRPLEAVKAAGGTWADQMRYGAVPQVLPGIISYTLLRFEINVRASSIIGYVGAGGLGQEFRVALSYQEYTDLSALFVIILVTIAVIDWGSERLRHRVIGLEAGR